VGTLATDVAAVSVDLFSGSVAAGAPLASPSATVSGSSWSATSPALTDGTYTMRATQSDQLGNTGTATRTFMVDTQPPAVTVTAPIDGSTTGDATPPITGTAGTAGGDSSSVNVTLTSGGTVVHLTAPLAGDGSWSVAPATPLAPGTYTVEVTQADQAGNVGESASGTFTVVGDGPPIAIFAFAPIGPVAGEVVQFDGSGSHDPDGTVTSWGWNFGDGATASGAAVSHAFAAGTFDVQLLVTDNLGSHGATAQLLTVGALKSSPQPHAPKLSTRVARQRLGAVLRRGLAVTVSSDTDGAADLRLLVSTRTARRLGLKRTTTLGRAVTSLSGGRARSVHVVLAKRARAALKPRKALNATLRVSLGATRIALPVALKR
jgi:hypothetical protein